MKEINLAKDIESCNGEIIEEITQSIGQYGNPFIQIVRIGKAYIYREDTGSDSTDYLIEKSDKFNPYNAKEFLEQCAIDWANNCEDPELELFQWGICDPEDYRYEGGCECKILVVGWYNGYQPVSWLKDEQWNEIFFENSKEAQAWIDDAESETYYLSHNEAGRPDYYIIEA